MPGSPISGRGSASFHPYTRDTRDREFSSSTSPRTRQIANQFAQTSLTSPPILPQNSSSLSSSFTLPQLLTSQLPPPPLAPASLARNKVRPIGPVMTKAERDALTLPPIVGLSPIDGSGAGLSISNYSTAASSTTMATTAATTQRTLVEPTAATSSSILSSSPTNVKRTAATSLSILSSPKKVKRNPSSDDHSASSAMTVPPSATAWINNLDAQRPRLQQARSWILSMLEDVSVAIRELDNAIQRGKQERELKDK